MGAIERLGAKGLVVLFNSMWRLKKPWQEYPVGSVFYVDDESESGALMLYPVPSDGVFIDRPLEVTASRFLAYFDTTKKVEESEVLPHFKLDDLLEARHTVILALSKPGDGLEDSVRKLAAAGKSGETIIDVARRLGVLPRRLRSTKPGQV